MLVRNRTFSCPVPYTPKSPDRIREENAARNAEMVQDRAALQFAEKLQQRKSRTRLRSSTTAIPSRDQLKKSMDRKSEKKDLSIDLSSITGKPENESSLQARNATLSARDFLRQRQKEAIKEQVEQGGQQVIQRTQSARV